MSDVSMREIKTEQELKEALELCCLTSITTLLWPADFL